MPRPRGGPTKAGQGGGARAAIWVCHVEDSGPTVCRRGSMSLRLLKLFGPLRRNARKDVFRARKGSGVKSFR